MPFFFHIRWKDRLIPRVLCSLFVCFITHHAGSRASTCIWSSACQYVNTVKWDDASCSHLTFPWPPTYKTGSLLLATVIFHLALLFCLLPLICMLYFGLYCSCTFAKLLPPYVCGEKAFISNRTYLAHDSLPSSSPSMYTWPLAAPLCIFPGDKTRRSHAPAPPVILMQRHFFARARIP